MGIVDGNKAESDGLGCESAGIVTHVGPDVKNLKIGDRVAVFSGNSYSTTLTTSSKLCVKMADGLTFEEAATMPCVYGTVIYSLLEIAKLEKDQVRFCLYGGPIVGRISLMVSQTVLIHSACGGIGLSAIQVCQMAGAEVSRGFDCIELKTKNPSCRSMQQLGMRKRYNILWTLLGCHGIESSIPETPAFYRTSCVSPTEEVLM